MSRHVSVIGAGVVGAATALRLVEQGFRVSIFDAALGLAQGASGANGAQLSYNNTEAFASPDTLKSLPKLLLGLDLSFRLSPSIDLEFIRWGMQFLLNSTQARADKNTLALLELALSSRLAMQEWDRKYAFEYQKTPAQKLHLYESTVLLDKAQRVVELKNFYGANQQIIDRQKVFELEPSLAQMNADLVGGIYSPNDDVGDVIGFTKAAIEKSLTLGGGELHLGKSVSDIVVEQGRCKALVTNSVGIDSGKMQRGGIESSKMESSEIETDAVVICAGYQSSRLSRKLGIKCAPIIPVAGYSLTFPSTEFTPNVSLTDVANKIVLCRLGNQLRVAGMADVGRIVHSPPRSRLEQLERLVISRFPDAGNYRAASSSWAGMRPMTPSSQPIIQQTTIENVFINSGHGMLGWTLAAGSANKLTRLLLRQFE